MLAAKTKEGANAREVMLEVKDAVEDYMRLEVTQQRIQAQKELEEQMSKLAIKDERLEELEGVQTRLQATLEAASKGSSGEEGRA